MKKGSTNFLRVTTGLLGVAVLALCIFGVPVIAREIAAFVPEFAYLNYFTFACLYATLIPFYLTLYQTFKLLRFIDRNDAFSALSVRALKTIKYCALTMTGLYILCMPLVFIVAEKDDAPGLVVIGAVFSCAPLIIAVFAAVLQKLVQNAIDIKTENELTV